MFLQVYVVALALFLQKCIRLNGVYYIFVYFYILSCIMQTSDIQSFSVYEQLDRVHASIVPDWINSRAPSGLFVQTLSRDRVYNLLSNISSLRARIGEKNEGYLDSSKAQKYMNLLTLEKALHESRKRDLKIGLNAFQQTGSAYHTRCKMPTYYV